MRDEYVRDVSPASDGRDADCSASDQDSYTVNLADYLERVQQQLAHAQESARRAAALVAQAQAECDQLPELAMVAPDKQRKTAARKRKAPIKAARGA